MGSYVIISIVTSVVMLLLAVVGLWSASVAVMDEAIPVRTLLEAALVYLPAMWTMIGVAVLLTGFLPQFTRVTSLYYFVFIYSCVFRCFTSITGLDGETHTIWTYSTASGRRNGLYDVIRNSYYCDYPNYFRICHL